MKTVAGIVTAFLLTCTLSAAPALSTYRDSEIDVAPDHVNFWMVDPAPHLCLGLIRPFVNLVFLGLAPKATAAFFAATYAAGYAADWYYSTAKVGGTFVISDGNREEAALMSPGAMSSSYLFCVSEKGTKFATDASGHKISVVGRWTVTTHSLQMALFFGRNLFNDYTFLVAKDAMVDLRNQCASTLNMEANSVVVRVKNTEYTTKTSGYKVDTFRPQDSDAHYWLAK